MKMLILLSLLAISNLVIAGEYRDPGQFIYPEYTSKKFIIKKDIEIGFGEKVITFTNGNCELKFSNRNCDGLNRFRKECHDSDFYKAGTILTIDNGFTEAMYGNNYNDDKELFAETFLLLSEKSLTEEVYNGVVALQCKKKINGIHGAFLSMAFHKTPLQNLAEFEDFIDAI